MQNFTIKTYNNIAEKGLDYLRKNKFNIIDDNSSHQGILLRSHKLSLEEINDETIAIARAGAGVNNIPIEECTKKGIVVFNTPGANANAVKELVIAGLVISSRNIIDANREILQHSDDNEIDVIAEKVKKKFVGGELGNKTIAIIGLGNIGIRVANSLHALGMKVKAYDPFYKQTEEDNFKLFASLEDCVKGSDFLSVHIPYSEKTKHIVDQRIMELMNNSGAILNFSRSGIVKQEDIITCIKNKKIKNYITDFAHSSLIKIPEVITFPHLGASTVEAEENCSMMAGSQLVNFLKTGEIINSVNFPKVILEKESDQYRIGIHHLNVPSMCSDFLNIISQENNISEMLNKSKGDYAYTLIDTTKEISDEKILQIKKQSGVLLIRKI